MISPPSCAPPTCPSRARHDGRLLQAACRRRRPNRLDRRAALPSSGTAGGEPAPPLAESADGGAYAVGAAIWSAPALAESWTIDLDDPASSSTSPGGAPELLAHGSAFVGRHLEMHALIRSCLHNQLTAVYGGKGTGKSALVLEAARYMRQRNRFPHGIFCASLEGLRSMKAVRTRLGSTLNIPARSSQELCDLMARFNSSLLILDRCEDAIRKKMPQFVWFLTQLLQNTSVKILLLSQTALEGFPRHTDSTISSRSITLPPMRPRDSALLLLES